MKKTSSVFTLMLALGAWAQGVDQPSATWNLEIDRGCISRLVVQSSVGNFEIDRVQLDAVYSPYAVRQDVPSSVKPGELPPTNQYPLETDGDILYATVSSVEGGTQLTIHYATAIRPATDENLDHDDGLSRDEIAKTQRVTYDARSATYLLTPQAVVNCR